MKRNLLLAVTFILTLNAFVSKAQVADGTISQDWTLSDINGKSWHLYDVLNSGKTVVLDLSATWCGPCWQYHKSGEFDKFYTAQGPSGTNKAVAIFVEVDATTTSADLHGTGSNTQGDWVTGSNYPICDPLTKTELHNFGGQYNVQAVPMIMIICTDKKIYNVDITNATSAKLTSYVQADCPASTTGINENPASVGDLVIFPNPATSAVNINFNFFAETKNVTAKLINSLGQVVCAENYGTLNSGTKHYTLNLPSSLAKGFYFINVQTEGEVPVMQKISIE